MIQMRTWLTVADNSGARKLTCIMPVGGDAGLQAGLGDVITAAVKEATPESQVKKGTVVKAVVVRMRKERRRKDGTYIRFDDNAAVLINDAGEPVGKHQGWDCGERSGDQRLERDGRLRKLRQTHADWPRRFAGRHESAQLPPLPHDVGQIKDKVEEGNEESIAGKIPDGDGSRADEALWLEEHDGRAQAEENHGQHRSRRSKSERQAPGHRGG